MNKPSSDNECIIPEDKRLFAIHMGYCGLPVPQSFGVMRVRGGVRSFFDLSATQVLDTSSLVFPLFVKGKLGFGGHQVSRVLNFDELDSISLSDGEYLLQKPILQHSDMVKMGSSVNTVRIVTTLVDGKTGVLASILRCGTSKTGYTDNTSSGGLVVGIIDSSGQLANSAASAENYPLPIDRHPDTLVSFASFKVPFYEDVKNLALRAHRTIPHIVSIGWDIGITDEGPVLIEGNGGYEIRNIQMGVGGLRKPYLDLWREWRCSHRVSEYFF